MQQHTIHALPWAWSGAGQATAPIAGSSRQWLFNPVCHEIKRLFYHADFLGERPSTASPSLLLCCWTGLGVSHCEFPKRLMIVCVPLPVSCNNLHLPFTLQILSGKGILSPFIPTLHLHSISPFIPCLCAGLQRRLPDADGGEVGLFIWPVLFGEAVDVRIIMPFQADRLSYRSVTSTDRAQGSACACTRVCACAHVRQGALWTEPRHCPNLPTRLVASGGADSLQCTGGRSWSSLC